MISREHIKFHYIPSSLSLCRSSLIIVKSVHPRTARWAVLSAENEPKSAVPFMIRFAHSILSCTYWQATSELPLWSCVHSEVYFGVAHILYTEARKIKHLLFATFTFNVLWLLNNYIICFMLINKLETQKLRSLGIKRFEFFLCKQLLMHVFPFI